MSKIFLKKPQVQRLAQLEGDAARDAMSGPNYAFEGWVLDSALGALTGENGQVLLRPKSFEVLQYLIRNAGQLVRREEVLDAVWPGVIVTEESLTQCVSEIRQALGDTGQRIIKTVPKRGYVFAAALSDRAVRSGGADVQIAQVDPVVAGAGQAIARYVLEGPSVAVLPFVNLSGDPAQDYLGDGVTEDVINGLSRFSGLSVIARNSSFSYKGRAIDVREAGAQLGVRYIVEGSVRRFDDRIRITAQLVDAQSGVQRWSERFDRAVGDIFAVQDEITQAIVAIVVAHLGNAEIERAARKPQRSWTAYDLTLQGDQAQNLAEQFWDARYVNDARRFYAEAFRIDPDNARICAKLGHTYVRAYADPASPDLGEHKQLEHGFQLARQAVGLDPNLPLAHAQLGWANAWMRQPDAAISEFEKAAALNPSFVDYRYALILTFAGEAERALHVERDYVRLDPFYGSMLPVIRGIALYLLGRYQEALEALRETRGRAPHVPGQAVLAATLIRLGQRPEAEKVVQEVLQRLPKLTRERWPMSSVFRNPQDGERLFEALGEAGFP